MDDLIKTILLQAPNFVGFLVLSYVLVRFVIQPGIELIHKQNETIKELAFKLAELDDAHPVKKETD